MQIEIIHETEYEYAAAVFLEPHIFRFKPRATVYAHLLGFNLDIFPIPFGISEQQDVENNVIHFGWFEGMHTKMRIRATSLIAVKPYHPFNFLLFPEQSNNLPFVYPTTFRSLLKPYMEQIAIGADLITYCESILRSTNANTLGFLSDLTSRIHNDFVLELREIGEPYPPDETFRLKLASCRDLAWMQIHVLRYYGMAARFVSGYFYVAADNPTYELHAWTEVFLPGAGWIGYDPSNGIRTSNMYFPVSSSANYQNTMPISGSVRGGARSVLSSSLAIRLH